MLRPSPLSRLCSLIAIACALTICLPRAQGWMPHPHKEARQQIEELEQQWRVATLSADVPAMDRMLSDDYVGISWNGQVNTKAMQLDRTRNRSFALTRMDLFDTKVKIVGNVAIVTARAELEGTNDGADLKGMFRYTRVYQKLPSGIWKITNFEATRVPEPGDHPHHSHSPQR
jgi:ketosteroid isomerase-like protein